MTQITDIFFDLDHTLWDFDKNSELSYIHIFKSLKIELSVTDFLKVYTDINKQLWKLFREDLIDKESLRYRRLKESFAAVNYEISDSLINQIADDYIVQLSKQSHLFPGTTAVLEYLQSKYKLHIITNGFAEVQDRKLKNTGLSRFFNVVMNSETAGVKKPHPLIFEKSLALAGVKKENALMIGDSLEADVMGALNFGIKAICYNYHNDVIPNKIMTITHLEELVDLL